MSAQKTIIALGMVGFIVCLGALLLKTYDLHRLQSAPMSLPQEAEALQEVLLPANVDVDAKAAQIAINLPGDRLFFAYNDSSLTLEAQRKIQLIAEAVVQRYEKYEVRVVGHTDSRGDANYNKGLGLSRAEAVADFLLANGVKSSFIRAMSMGEQAPMASNQTDQGRALNRRVEVQMVPHERITEEEEPTTERARHWIDLFIKVLQTNPVFVILGSLSSLITVGTWLAGFRGSRRHRGFA